MSAPRATPAWVYARLYGAYGAQGWWPGHGTFEVMVGAVLTQNTAWANAARAIAALRGAGMLDPARIVEAPADALAERLRPSGCYRVKSRRLRNLCRWYLDAGGRRALARRPTERLRRALLSVDGVGPETADAIVLYGFGRARFVIDAYTRRLLVRLGLAGGGESYARLQGLFEQALPAEAALYNEYHALIVRHGKTHCAARPRCEGCPLRRRCGARFSATPAPG